MIRKALIACVFILSGVLFALSPVDWDWARNGGSSFFVTGYGISADSSGNSYISGYYYEDISFGSITLTASSDFADIFVAKLDADGNWLWAKSAGGIWEDNGYGIAVDAEGNCFITGDFYDAANFGPFALSSSDDSDCYIAKLDTNGNWLWAKSAGGSGRDHGIGVGADSDGNCFVTGWFSNTAAFDSLSVTSSGGWDVFVAKLDADGNWLWVNRAGGLQDDGGLGISVDNQGSVYVTGTFKDNAAFGDSILTSRGGSDIFVAKLDNNGNWLWAVPAGGSGGDLGSGIATDSAGNSYITASASGTVYFGANQFSGLGSVDIYAAKLDADGNWLWIRQAGGTGPDHSGGIAVSPCGSRVVLTGDFYSTAAFGASSLVSSGGNDIFTAGLDADGNWLWVKQAGGPWEDYGTGVAMDATGNSYVTGNFDGSAGFGMTTLNGIGFTDVFVAKLSPVVPRAPQNPLISASGNDIHLAWDAVVLDTKGRPLTTDFYRIYYQPVEPQSDFILLADQVQGTEWIHSGAASQPHGFYLVKAVKQD